MSPRRKKKQTILSPDRTRGTIISFKTELGRGVVESAMYKLAFSARDVQGYRAGTDLTGLGATFSVERDREGKARRAFDIVVPSLSHRRYPQNPDDLDEEELRAVSRGGAEADREEDESPPVEIPEEQRVALALLGPAIKLVTLTPDGKYRFLDEQKSKHNLLYRISAETVALERAIEEFEDLMNDPKALEEDFQKFFERHTDFILNDDYREAHPHLILENAEGENLIPDFILQPVNQGALCALLELKLPSAPVFVMQKNRPRYSAAVHEAAAQLREYSRYFNDATNQARFRNKYPLLNVYRPRMFVIIGRRGAEDVRLAREVEADVPELYLNTYDDVLRRVKWKLDRMKIKGRGRP